MVSSAEVAVQRDFAPSTIKGRFGDSLANPKPWSITVRPSKRHSTTVDGLSSYNQLGVLGYIVHCRLLNSHFAQIYLLHNPRECSPVPWGQLDVGPAATASDGETWIHFISNPLLP